MEEAQSEKQVFLDRQRDGRLRIVCERCKKWRDFGTEQGALTWYAGHTITIHRVRPLFKKETERRGK